tara:strand:+ start:7301 stop:8446 length:1146 start_codon:yes stop_codon:yes gene_type:complete
MADLLSELQNAAGWKAEGKRLAVEPLMVTAKDAARFIAEMTPVLGDVMAAKELWDEATSENPNWVMVGALGGAAVIGLIPGIGDVAAKGIKAGAKKMIDTAKRVEVDPNAMGSGLGNVRLKPSLPPAKTAAEQVAKDVLELRAVGKADEVSEEMMALADDQYMSLNTPISMSQEARMARADEMFPREGFHGTNANIDGFQGNVFSSDNPTLASTYAKGSADAQIYPLRLGSKLGDTVVEGGGVNWYGINKSDIKDSAVVKRLKGDEISTGEIEQAAIREGRSGVQFKDIYDTGPGFNSNQFKNLGYTKEQERALQKQYMENLSKPSNVDVRLSPNLVRSKFARFDPEFRNLRNLSAGLGIAPLGLLALLQEQERENEGYMY